MAFTIAVASGKGGTGKTSVSVRLFQSLQERFGENTGLVDCDVEEPNAGIFFSETLPVGESAVMQEIPVIDTERCIFCRKCSEYCEFNAIVVIPTASFARVNPSLCHSCGACQVACESGAIWVKEEPVGTISRYRTPSNGTLTEGRLKIGSAMQTMVIRSLKRSVRGRFEVLVLDAPPGTSCPVVETISDAGYVVLVTEPTPFGMYDLKLMVELLEETGNRFGVVVNKAGTGDRALYPYLEEKNIEILAEIPFSREFAACYAKGSILEGIPDEVRKAYRSLEERIQTIIDEGDHHSQR